MRPPSASPRPRLSASPPPEAGPEGEVVGYYRGAWRRLRRDRVSMVALALFLLLCLLSMFAMIVPPTLLSLSILFGLWGWSGVSRVVRGQTMAGRQRDYVDAARALGAGNLRIMYRHILPNTGSIVLTIVGFDVA